MLLEDDCFTMDPGITQTKSTFCTVILSIFLKKESHNAWQRLPDIMKSVLFQDSMLSDQLPRPCLMVGNNKYFYKPVINQIWSDKTEILSPLYSLEL